MEQVRVRFAPSPTGKVHIGNIRAAIFNWLYARHVGGKFLLRVEDTDLERSTPEAIQTLLECMEWLGLDFDEPVVYQTHNVQKHLEAAEKLLAEGYAYKETEGPKAGCIVFRMPKEGRIEFEDLVKGRMKKKAEDTQDFVIVRSDGSPVFHLANVVDDMLQNITLVIRGDDHVENTFKHIELFKALGYTPPQYAHLPMIVNNMGKPYSKRDGAAFVGEFREQGYLPETLFNFLLLLGWAPGDDREVMTREEMIEAFSLERCKSSPSRFDMKKLRWMNGEYIAKQPKEQFKAELVARLKAAGLPEQPLNGSLDAVIGPVQPRTKVYTELPGNCIYFFTEEYPFDEAAVTKRLKQPGVRELLEEMANRFEALEDFTEEATEAIVRAKSEELGGMGPVVHPIRVAVSGITEGPGLFELLVLVGKERTVARLRKAAATLPA